MAIKRFDQTGGHIIIHTDGEFCESTKDLFRSDLFKNVIKLFVRKLRHNNSSLLDQLSFDVNTKEGMCRLIELLQELGERPSEQLLDTPTFAKCLLKENQGNVLLEFVEKLYNFWRSFDRFMVLHSEPGPSSFEKRPYMAFNETMETLTHMVRAAYRDLRENITGKHPRVYRQVAAGCNVGIIAVKKECKLPPVYRKILGDIPFIRQVLIDPPMIIDPPMNKRTGTFQRVNKNPLSGLDLVHKNWVCYPARVGPTVVFIYFHQRFIDLGCSLANLFELADDEHLAAGPDAIYVFGAPPKDLATFGKLPTVFYEDTKNDILVAAIPREDRFGYFGYLKKMALTLHNVIMMKRGRMPYHGAMVRLLLNNGREANILLIGNTAAGKSETLEALRLLGKEHVRSLEVIADDMGSLKVDDMGRVLGYGTEVGAFIRLDDLQKGYAFEQIGRAIIMSPHRVNARVVLPVTTIENVLRGYPVDLLLYANNYEEVDQDHPLIERFSSVSQALKVFREGTSMAKGTTSATGLTHRYFANVFGPHQYQDLHDGLAKKVFTAAFKKDVFVGQMRTRLGIPGCETKGPKETAKALLELISKRPR